MKKIIENMQKIKMTDEEICKILDISKEELEQLIKDKG